MGKKDNRHDYREAFNKEADKTSARSMAAAVGMPDDEDWRNIIAMIEIFRQQSVEKYGFDILVDCIATARKEYAALGTRYSAKTAGLVSEDSGMFQDFELPADFILFIEKAYPTIFRDKEHYRWFKKKFVGMTIHGEKR